MQHRVCPVIHVETSDQLERNIQVAIGAGADGVFLIGHDMAAEQLWLLFRGARARHPDLWIGLNYLGLPLPAAAKLASGADALWMDGLPKNRLDLSIPVFGGVAFKYQHSRLTLQEEVNLAIETVDVIVTSGNATGKAASVEKVSQIKSLVGDTQVGLASGLTTENVQSYLPWVEWLLVATGVSSDFNNLCPVKLAEFVSAVRSYSHECSL